MNLPIFIYCIVLAILVGSIYYDHLKPSRLHLFLPFLVLTLLVELLGLYMKYLDKSNSILYNVFIMIQVLFSTWFFTKAGISPSLRKFLNGALIVYLFAILLHYIFLPASPFSTWLFLLGGLLVVLAGLFFLLNFFLLDNRSKEMVYSPVIPVAMGLIAFFSVCSIVFSFLPQIKYYDLEIGGEKLYNFLPRMMSIILYLCFAYAFFLCRKPVQA